METIVDIEVPGEPVGKGRARFGNGRTYTPAKTVSYESMVKGYAYEAMAGREPTDLGVRVEITAYFGMPKSMNGKGKGSAVRYQLAMSERLPVLKKPDGDNIAKIILDPMNAIVFKDDSQAYDIHVVKLYSPRPRVRVRVML